MGHLTATDDDDGPTTWQVSDDRFEVDCGALRPRAGVAPDQEAEPTAGLSVTATDQSAMRDFPVKVADVCEAPPSFGVPTGFRVDKFDAGDDIQTIEGVDWNVPPDHREVVDRIDCGGTGGSFRRTTGATEFGTRVIEEIGMTGAGSHDAGAIGPDTVRIPVDGVEIVRGVEGDDLRKAGPMCMPWSSGAHRGGQGPRPRPVGARDGCARRWSYENVSA